MLWHFFSKALILLEFAIRGNFQEFQGVKKFLQKYSSLKICSLTWLSIFMPIKIYLNEH